jgi:hypothetical protein
METRVNMFDGYDPEQVIRFPAEKTLRCRGCNRRVYRRTMFADVLDAMITNPDGTPRTREQVEEELGRERLDWLALPVVCSRCVKAGWTPEGRWGNERSAR